MLSTIVSVAIPLLIIITVLVFVLLFFLSPTIQQVISDCTAAIGTTICNGLDAVYEMLMNLYRYIEEDMEVVIDDIIFRAKNNPYDPKQQKHHIAPQKLMLSGIYCSTYLVKSHINIDDPVNTIMLDASFHRALNTNIYYSLIYSSTKIAFETSQSPGVYLTLFFYNVLLGILNEGVRSKW